MTLRLTSICVALGIFLLSSGCGEAPPEAAYVARVGDAYLTEQELAEALPQLGADSTAARQQFIEQWITNQLLYREAQRRNLANEPSVQQRIREEERSILINALTNRLFETTPAAPSPSDIASYYERNKNQLRLREPFVRIRYLSTTNINTARSVREELVDLDDSAAADSMWAVLVNRHAAEPAEAHELAAHHYPRSTLFPQQAALRNQLNGIAPGATSEMVRNDGRVHVIQLVSEVPAGTIPEQAWVEDTIRRRLQIRARKQMYAREVQRLRNEARAEGAIEIR